MKASRHIWRVVMILVHFTLLFSDEWIHALPSIELYRVEIMTTTFPSEFTKNQLTVVPCNTVCIDLGYNYSHKLCFWTLTIIPMFSYVWAFGSISITQQGQNPLRNNQTKCSRWIDGHVIFFQENCCSCGAIIVSPLTRPVHVNLYCKGTWLCCLGNDMHCSVVGYHSRVYPSHSVEGMDDNLILPVFLVTYIETYLFGTNRLWQEIVVAEKLYSMECYNSSPWRLLMLLTFDDDDDDDDGARVWQTMIESSLLLSQYACERTPAATGTCFWIGHSRGQVPWFVAFNDHDNDLTKENVGFVSVSSVIYCQVFSSHTPFVASACSLMIIQFHISRVMATSTKWLLKNLMRWGNQTAITEISDRYL